MLKNKISKYFIAFYGIKELVYIYVQDPIIFPVVHISRNEHEIGQFSFLVDNQMELESKELICLVLLLLDIIKH